MTHDDALPGAVIDLRYMHAALGYGRRGLGRTAPNPSVGAIVVKDGIVVGRGCTADGGRPHGEAVALAQAGEAARGATIYVTLEPCSHQGRGGPCCEAIVAAGIARLVYALDDPNPLAGGGAAYCRAHGLAVTAGVGADAASRDHLGHLLRVTKRRPAVTLKLAETADGFVAGGPHDPRLAITGAAANGAVHVMRSLHEAILVGIGTVLADDPLMTVRLPGLAAKPLRIVLDARLDLPRRSRLAETAKDAPVLVLTGAEAEAERGHLFAEAGIEVVAVPLDRDGRIDLPAALEYLASRGLTRIFSEGGPRIASALIRQGLADDVLVVTAPRPFGGEGVPSLDALARAALADRYRTADRREIGIDRLHHYERIA